MQKKRKLDAIHVKTLQQLFEKFDSSKKYSILDAGSGRTSLCFLTKKFPKSNITAIIYPGDDRKRKGINESVTMNNFVLQEADIHAFKQKRIYDIVLAHLLLGEANKFSTKGFEKMLNSLFSIKTKYLIIVDILDDKDVDYTLLLKYIAQKGYIQKIILVDKLIGFFLLKK